MQAFLVSLSTIAVAEMGDRTQFLCLMLAARFRKPIPILAGVLVATIADHLAAGFIGVWFGHRIAPAFLDALVGWSMIIMAIWTVLTPTEQGGGKDASGRGAFLTTALTFFVAELGDKTQIATLALAAAYSNLFLVVAGSTTGMLVASAPVIFLGEAFSRRLPIRSIKIAAAFVFLAVGIYFAIRAGRECWPPVSWACATGQR